MTLARRTLVLLIVSAALAAPAAPAYATKPKPQPGDRYVALGSSYASGPSIPQTIDATCARSSNNYAHVVAARLKLALTDVTCGGATTANILNTPQASRPPQITAVTPATKLVTVTIGGNNIGYSTALFLCGDAGSKGQPCLDTIVNRAQINAALAALPGQMVAMLRAIKQAAPNAIVYLVAYPRVLPTSNTPCPPSVPMDPAALAFLRGVGLQLQRAFVSSAHAAHVGFIDSYSPKGHDACAAPAQRWIEGMAPARAAALFHPNFSAMAAQAALIVKAVKAR
jgi:GDSL-like Lipase/Acylhydrolase family